MKRLLILPLLLLAGCATAAGTASPTSILTEVQAVCAEALPLAAAVPSVGVYATAFCAASNLAATTLTPADLAWISNILGELKGNIAPAPVQVAAPVALAPAAK